MDTHKDPREYPRFGPASNQFETYRMQQSNYITGLRRGFGDRYLGEQDRDHIQNLNAEW